MKRVQPKPVKAEHYPDGVGPFTSPIAVVPDTPEAFDAMVGQAAAESYGKTRLAGAGHVFDMVQVGEDAAIAAFRAIGITRPEKARKR